MELILQSLFNILKFDQSFIDIVYLSLLVSLVATIVSAFISIIISSHMAIKDFFGKEFLIIVINSFMSIPPVVVGLVLYLLFSSSGYLGYLDLLYTAEIMVIAQFIIVTPIIISLSFRTLSDQYERLSDYLQSLKCSSKMVRNTIIFESRYDLLIIIITGLSRALSEVGAVIIVGGNIDNLTRVMTTSIVLETSRGELSLALSLGISLIIIALIMNFLIALIKKRIL
ncbi:MAG: ABC transporter permease [Gammaproteobacteria bacterium]|nr:ABC transporter permease [Gammaproteobacteria bacterium]MBL6818961.1 ABC transporter permease [Gammaproteobacteria bacterium]MBL6898944.1 ABC transporter permease [Gammaproteobacteria bacterium]